MTIVVTGSFDGYTREDIVKVIEENGVVCNFERLKPLDIKKRLKAICNAYEVNVSEQNLDLLIETSGTNMQSLINEIRKRKITRN